MAKSTSLNRMKGRTRVIPVRAWFLGFNIYNKINKSLIINNTTKVSESLIQNNNECNNFRWNPPTNNPMYVV